MKGYKNKFRTVLGDGTVKTFPTRGAADASAAEQAERTNSTVSIDEWSLDHPQDEINDGWACVGVKYAPGKEPVPPSDKRGPANEIHPGDRVTVFAFPANPGLESRGGDVTGTVTAIEQIHMAYRGTGVRLTMSNGLQYDAVDGAVTYWLNEKED